MDRQFCRYKLVLVIVGENPLPDRIKKERLGSSPELEAKHGRSGVIPGKNG
jgi:hypothetical protein